MSNAKGLQNCGGRRRLKKQSVPREIPKKLTATGETEKSIL
jgi:hypothetical protein